ncbi:MAG: hypothetical protein WC243_00145 [Patescibacteria group bacterium]|jgi:hypothetical protein
MSVLSAHIGSKQVTFLAPGLPKKGYEIFRFPFLYNPVLQVHFTDRKTFYTDVFRYAIKKLGLSVQDCDILICSDLEPVELDLDIKVSTPASALLADLLDFNVMYVNSTTSITPSRMSKEDILAFLANLALVPNMIVEKAKFKMYHDFVRFGSLDKAYELDPKLPILFCGDRFSSEYVKDTDMFQSLLTHIRTPGVFSVLVDMNGSYLPSLMLKKYRPEVYESLLSPDVIPTILGTVVRVDSAVECLFSTDSGTSQFFEVPRNNLFFVPLEGGSKAHISVKSSSLGQYEGTVGGGKLGFVVDTRSIDSNDPGIEEENIISYENIERQIGEALAVL